MKQSKSSRKRVLSALLLAAVLLTFAPPAPRAAAPTAKVVQVSAGYFYTAAIRDDGSLWTWGNNGHGQLGDGTNITCAVPMKQLDDVVAVSTWGFHTAAIRTDGTLWTWGNNDYGQLGDGTLTSRSTPAKVMEGVRAVSVGQTCTMAVLEDNSLWIWGEFHGYEVWQAVPVPMLESVAPMKLMDDVAAVQVGYCHIAVIRTDDSLWLWGDNSYGQLGDGTLNNTDKPKKVMDDVAEVALGIHYTAALKKDGTLWTWGENRSGALGDETYEDRRTPGKVLDDVAAVRTGGSYTAVLKTDGTLWTWGYIDFESSDISSRESYRVPFKELDGVASFDAGALHIAVIKTDGTVWTWGDYDRALNGMWCRIAYADLTQVYLDEKNVPLQTVYYRSSDDYKTYDTVSVERGASIPQLPIDAQSREGFLFAGWYYDSYFTEPVQFPSDTAERNTVLFAAWVELPTERFGIPEHGTAYATMSYGCLIDGNPVSLAAYAVKDTNGNDTNYVKLRDMAVLLDGTPARFNVDWDGTITLQRKVPYTTKNGTELAPPSSQTAAYSAAPIVLRVGDQRTAAVPIAITDANGGGHTYFKLRDLGEIIGFDVDWDDAQKAIVIDTTARQSVAMITDIGTIDDKSFNEGAWRGIVAYCRANGIEHKYFQPSEQSNAEYLAQIELAVSSGATVIVTPGFLFEEPIFLAQDMYPDITFILIDGTPHDANYSEFHTAENTVSVLYAEEQAGYLAGYAAVKGGYTKLGFMGGMAVPAVVRYGLGFVQGANDAAVEFGVGTINMKYHYTGGFEATPEAQSLAASWYFSGTEVIFGCGGAVGFSVMAAAQEYDGKVIGIDIDQSPESDTVITSAMKGLSASVEQMLAAYFVGEFPGGQNITLDASRDGVLLPMMTTKISGFTQADYDTVFARLVSDSVTIQTPYDYDNAAQHFPSFYSYPAVDSIDVK